MKITNQFRIELSYIIIVSTGEFPALGWIPKMACETRALILSPSSQVPAVQPFGQRCGLRPHSPAAKAAGLQRSASVRSLLACILYKCSFFTSVCIVSDLSGVQRPAWARTRPTLKLDGGVASRARGFLFCPSVLDSSGWSAVSVRTHAIWLVFPVVPCNPGWL